jgi:predicted nuclease with TOPRIM domain
MKQERLRELEYALRINEGRLWDEANELLSEVMDLRSEVERLKGENVQLREALGEAACHASDILRALGEK